MREKKLYKWLDRPVFQANVEGLWFSSMFLEIQDVGVLKTQVGRGKLR